jgi:hypothetical protein
MSDNHHVEGRGTLPGLPSSLASVATWLGVRVRVGATAAGGVGDDATDDGANALSTTGQAAIACLVIYTVVCIPAAVWLHRWRAPIQGR